MERNEISVHEVIVYKALVDADGKWRTNKQLAVAAKKIAEQLGDGLRVRVAPRTVRAHTAKLVGIGIVDQAEVFPGHRFRLSSRDDKQNGRYVGRLEAAAETIDLPLKRAQDSGMA